MHPWLRHLAISRVNAAYLESAPEGIFEREGEK
jgi:hypothetical protein